MYGSESLDDLVLDILVPQASKYDVEDIINSTEVSELDEVDESSWFPSVAQRGVLYFDESIPIYVVLRTPYYEELELSSLVARLAINVEVFVTGDAKPSKGQDVQQETSPSLSRALIWSAAVNTAEEPLIIIQQKDNQNSNPHGFLIWKLQAFLNRPRVRMQSPTIIFKPSAVLRPVSIADDNLANDYYLPSGVPASINLLESLKSDPVLDGTELQLTALRLLRIDSTNQEIASSDQIIKSLPERVFRAIPAFTARVRYSKSSSNARKPSIFASLDIETAPFCDFDLSFAAVRMNLAEGSAVDLATTHALRFPISCRPKDNLIFLFHLIPNGDLHGTMTSTAASKVLDITIEAIVLMSEVCRPCIEMRWKTGVDFATELNPSYGAPGQSLQRSQRPPSLPAISVNGNQGMLPNLQGAETPNSLSKSGQRQNTVASDFGITITFTAPSKVQVGEPFCWDMFVVNQSDKLRRLAILVMLNRKRGELKGHLSRPSSSSTGGRKETDIAEHIMDENLLYAMQRNSGKEPPQLVSLSTDVKVGPLHPGFCYNTDLKFLPLAKGVLRVEAIRVIDVISNEFLDIRDLPDIIAAEWAVDE